MPLTQAAKALGVSPTTVRRRVADGQLAGQRQPHRGGFRWLVLVPTEGDADVESHTDAPAFEAPPPAGPPADRRVAVRDALAEVRETEESLRELAARVDLASREIIHFVERERSYALVQADRLEDAAREAAQAERSAERAPSSPHLRVVEHVTHADHAGDDAETETLDSDEREDAPQAASHGESGSVRALLLSCAVLVAMVAVSFVALPAWTGGIIASVAVVAGLIAVVELFLVVSGAFADRGRLRHERSSR